MKSVSLRKTQSALLFVTVAGCGGPKQDDAGSASLAPGELDRTVLPIAEPAYPPITEIDATKKKRQRVNVLLTRCLVSLRGLRAATVICEGY